MTDAQARTRGRLQRVLENTQVLAGELAERDMAGPWSRTLTIEPAFDESTRPRLRYGPPADGGRVAVVCWDLGHNPAGRALVLADLHAVSSHVELVGPLWSRFGTDVWGPLKEARHPTVTFNCDRMADFAAKAYAVAAHHHYDLVHVCKPRLPGIILGSLLARASNCPIIVDIDDEERAFFADIDDVDLTALGPDALHEPTEAAGTALGVDIARNSSALTVSNVALRREYGGSMVRHARPERVFDPGAVSRRAGRARLGAAAEDFVVLFVGTPRPHKGLASVVEALRLLDDRFVLHVVGVSNRSRFDAELDTSGIRVITHLPTDMAILPELLAAGDAIALMQDLEDPISQFQIPSKISDGLSMGVPLVVSPAPPLADLHHHGIRWASTPEELARELDGIAAGEPSSAPRARRLAFLSEFSVGVNEARVRRARSQAEDAHEEGGDPVVERSVTVLRDAYLRERRRERADLFAEAAPDEDAAAEGGTDLVFFWKQNDSGIYGRRSDMLAKYFARDPRIRRVLHLDAPIATDRVAKDARLPPGTDADHEPLAARSLLDRRLGMLETGAVVHRTFLYRDEGATGRDPLTGVDLPFESELAAYVEAEMAALGMSAGRTLAWVCPVVASFPEVHGAIRFRGVVADVIDDQRAFGRTREAADEFDRHYRQLLGLADRVFTNCAPVARAFADYAPEMIIVPNGAETTAFSNLRAPIGDDERPVVAYVGNMSDRVDWGLLDDLASARSDCRFLMVGSAHPGSEVFDLVGRHENVELTGIVPYAVLPELLETVDIGIVPHLGGPMTERMNPLKVYNYYAAGLPIVSTPIENIAELRDHLTIATDARSFAAAIDAGVRRRRAGEVERDETLLAEIDWERRATSILDLLEADGLLG